MEDVIFNFSTKKLKWKGKLRIFVKLCFSELLIKEKWQKLVGIDHKSFQCWWYNLVHILCALNAEWW